MNWYIGQEIVCIKTHSMGLVREGQVYTIQGLQKSCCYNIIDVGIDAMGRGGRCYICRKSRVIYDKNLWFCERLFAPLEYNKEAIEELLKETIKL